MSLTAYLLGTVSQTHRGARRRFRNQLENLFGLDRKNRDRTVAEVILTLPGRKSSLPWVDRFLGQGRGRRFCSLPITSAADPAPIVLRDDGKSGEGKTEFASSSPTPPTIIAATIRSQNRRN